MNLFNSLCESVVEEMANLRGKVGRPSSIPNPPSFANKEKFGGQAGKYTGSQMLQILGDFLKSHGDTETSYEELSRDLNRYLTSTHGFRGTAAKYWTRTLSDAIYKFNHKVEVAADDSQAPENPTSEVGGEDEPTEAQEETPTSEVEPTEEYDYMTKKVLEYAKDLADEVQTAQDITANLPIVQGEIRGIMNKMNSGNEIHTSADKEEAKNKIISKYVPQVQKALDKLEKDGKVKREGEGFVYAAPEAAEGEGTGEVTTPEFDDEDLGDDDIEQYIDPTDIYRDRDFNEFGESVDMSGIYIDIFKSKGLIKE